MDAVRVKAGSTGCKNHRQKAFTDCSMRDHKGGVLKGTPLIFLGEPSGWF
jgi:hypothetical protein